ncbi:DUF6455 family protein [Rhizobium sp. C4]|uniref:DUF6455 family protein n=1 Tax=Rhizobium sp. C4 TaxID=1349800 RepID=UPI001E34A898|nr:DUF6455 family protein [Rhizobium sp. C4]MCD2171607.1 DUF6455 family protein [Rhizobium sp. C4]
MPHAMAKTEHNVFQSLRGRVQSWWQERQEIARELDELSALGDQGLAMLATDVGVNPQMLAAIVRHGASAADDMERLMRALNIDPDAVHYDEPGLYRGLQTACALCEDKGRCRHELDAGTASENYAHFCPNHETMSELRAHPEFQQG